LGAGLSSLDEAVSSSLFAESSNAPENVTEYMIKSLKLSVAIATLVALGTVIFSRLILSIYGPDYVDNSTWPLIIVGITLIPYAITPIYATYLRVRDRLVALVIYSALDVGLGVLLMYLLMLRYGLVGATLGWLASRVVVLAVILPLWRLQAQQSTQHKEVHHDQALG
jgi:O-antigen/teichoic acid export membrane protein